MEEKINVFYIHFKPRPKLTPIVIIKPIHSKVNVTYFSGSLSMQKMLSLRINNLYASIQFMTLIINTIVYHDIRGYE